MLYRTASLAHVQKHWKNTVFNESRPRCLDVDVALASISDRVGFYAVPSVQDPGFLRETDHRSARWDINMAGTTTTTTSRPQKKVQGVMNQRSSVRTFPVLPHSCANYGCSKTFRPQNACQCNSDCKSHGNCCYDSETCHTA